MIDEFDDHWVYDLDTQCIVCGEPLALDGVCDLCFDERATEIDTDTDEGGEG